MLTIRNLSKTFANGVAAVRPTDLTVETGERLVVLGPSGSGKSTFLRLLVGLEDATTGEIWKDAVRIDKLEPHRRGIGFLSQRPALYPHLTVRQNLEIGDWGSEIGDWKDGHRSVSSNLRSPIPNLQSAFPNLQFDDLMTRYPHQLSGGERQRVALAKLLLRGCDTWLLDEPFANLDPPFRAEFRHDLHLLSAAANATIILVSHDPIDASALGRRIGVFGDGVLRQVGTPDELRTRPDNRFVAFALGQFCFLDGTVARTGTGSGDFAVAGGPPEESGAVRLFLPPGLATSPTGRRLSLGLRPDDVMPDPDGYRDWQVVSAEPTGGGRLLTVAAGRHRLRAEWRPEGPAEVPPAVGSPWPWSVRAGRGLWFDGDTGARL